MKRRGDARRDVVPVVSPLQDRPLPLVTVVVPCRNERDYIAGCLDSIIASDYRQERLEVLVVDALSDDGTRSLVEGYTRRHPFVRMLDNPERVTPVAFNLGVQHARGALIMIMSAHASIAPDAIRKCVEYSAAYGADNVGGMWRIEPRGGGLWDRAVAQALSHPFGVGGGRYRTRRPAKPVWVDTAAYGCYRREVFQKIGLFNPKLTRGQDMEFNMRLRAAGGRTLLAPDVEITYYARSSLITFLRHNFRNGAWAILPFRYSAVRPVALRHLVPLMFVLALLASVTLAALRSSTWWILAGIAGAYLGVSLATAAQIAVRQRQSGFLVLMPVAFTALHLAYGLGSLWGVVRVAAALGSGTAGSPGDPAAGGTT